MPSAVHPPLEEGCQRDSETARGSAARPARTAATRWARSSCSADQRRRVAGLAPGVPSGVGVWARHRRATGAHPRPRPVCEELILYRASPHPGCVVSGLTALATLAPAGRWCRWLEKRACGSPGPARGRRHRRCRRRTPLGRSSGRRPRFVVDGIRVAARRTGRAHRQQERRLVGAGDLVQERPGPRAVGELCPQATSAWATLPNSSRWSSYQMRASTSVTSSTIRPAPARYSRLMSFGHLLGPGRRLDASTRGIASEQFVTDRPVQRLFPRAGVLVGNQDRRQRALDHQRADLIDRDPRARHGGQDVRPRLPVHGLRGPAAGKVGGCPRVLARRGVETKSRQGSWRSWVEVSHATRSTDGLLSGSPNWMAAV